MKNTRLIYGGSSTLLFIVLAVIFFWGERFIRVTFGDFLVVMFLYTSLMTLFPRLKKIVAGLIILGVAFSVEFLQMSVIPSLFNTSSKVVEATVGSTFDPHDLLAYTLGVAAVVAIDWFIANSFSKRTTNQNRT